jgi:hypothetical protein
MRRFEGHQQGQTKHDVAVFTESAAVKVSYILLRLSTPSGHNRAIGKSNNPPFYNLKTGLIECRRVWMCWHTTGTRKRSLSARSHYRPEEVAELLAFLASDRASNFPLLTLNTTLFSVQLKSSGV